MENQEPKHWNNLTEEERTKRKLLAEEGLVCMSCGKDITSEEEQKKLKRTDGTTCWECWYDPNEEPEPAHCWECGCNELWCQCPKFVDAEMFKEMYDIDL